MKTTSKWLKLSLGLIAWGATACNGGDLADGAPLGPAPETYSFSGKWEAQSSVAYSGQTLRHILIADITDFVGGLHQRIESGFATGDDAVLKTLDAYYEFDSDTSGAEAIRMRVPSFSALQSSYDDVATDKDLRGKIAGRDSGDRYHRDFATEFAGFDDEDLARYGGGIDSPDRFVAAIFATLNAQAIEQERSGLTREASDGRGGTVSLQTHQTASGLDLQQLLQKFLLGAVAFSQGTDDYLDEGLDADNSVVEEGQTFTALEHAWDEAFGYFGASRDYLRLSDESVAGGKSTDSNGDGLIDLTSEFCFGASANASKRDRGARSGIDLSGDAMRAFLRGRQLISSTDGPLDDATRAELLKARDAAAGAWEKAIAATAVHYINELIGDYDHMGTADYSFTDHAMHFSELKGFGLSLQFSPHSPLTLADYKALHLLIRDAPLLGDSRQDERADYTAQLSEARQLLGAAYDFDSDDVKNW